MTTWHITIVFQDPRGAVITDDAGVFNTRQVRRVLEQARQRAGFPSAPPPGED